MQSLRARHVDGREREFWLRVFWARSVALVVFGLVPFLSDYAPTSITTSVPPRSLSIVLLGIALPANLLFHRHLKQRSTLLPVVALVDQLMLVAVAAIVPELLQPLVLTMVMVAATWAAAFDTMTSLICSLGGLIVLIDALSIVDPTTSSAFVFFYIVALVFTTFVVGTIASNERQSRQHFEDLVNGVGAIAWWQIDADVEAFRTAGSTHELLGYSAAHWLDPAFHASLIHPNDLSRYWEAREAADTTGFATARYRVRAIDDTYVPVLDRMRTNRRGANGVARSGVLMDMSEQDQLARRADRFSEVVDQLPAGVCVVRLRADGSQPAGYVELVAANPFASIIVGRDVDALVGRDLRELVAGPGQTRIEDAVRSVIATGRATIVERVQFGNGQHPQPISAHVFALPEYNAGITFQAADSSGVELGPTRPAQEDPLTGLPNRSRLLGRLREATREADQADADVALIMIDLDGFKAVNDAVGHAEGDRLLIETADRLRAAVGDAGLVARIGGDEFAVLLNPSTAAGRADGFARRIIDRLEQPVRTHGFALPMRASLGLAHYPTDAPNDSELLRRAEVAMYAAKRRRSILTRYAPELDLSSARRSALVAGLPQAIENDELVLHFQPAVDVRTGRPLRAEALVRWRHPELGLVSPTEFVGLAETTGLVRTLTRWVTLNAVMTARSWMDAGISVGVAINLSARDLAADDFAPWLHTLLDTHGLPHSRLSVEVTESELMEDLERAKETLRALRGGGVRVAIDDFGTGYASLAYLGNLPIDEVKIDRSFVMAMNASSADAMIVRSTIDLCHNLGYHVVAEGVEDGKTMTRLAHLGCDVAQGFHIGQPMDHDNFLAWMAEHTSLFTPITI